MGSTQVAWVTATPWSESEASVVAECEDRVSSCLSLLGSEASTVVDTTPQGREGRYSVCAASPAGPVPVGGS